MCKGIGSLVEYGRKLMAWRDVKRDREKKVDDFAAEVAAQMAGN